MNDEFDKWREEAQQAEEELVALHASITSATIDPAALAVCITSGHRPEGRIAFQHLAGRCMQCGAGVLLPAG